MLSAVLGCPPRWAARSGREEAPGAVGAKPSAPCARRGASSPVPAPVWGSDLCRAQLAAKAERFTLLLTVNAHKNKAGVTMKNKSRAVITTLRKTNPPD